MELEGYAQSEEGETIGTRPIHEQKVPDRIVQAEESTRAMEETT